MRNPLRTRKRHRHPSLFGELVDWLLAPFLILWPISMALEYSLAYSVASAAYDRDLRDNVVALATLVSAEGGRVKAEVSPSASAILQARGTGDTLFQLRHGEDVVLAGDPFLPAAKPERSLSAGTVYFRDDTVQQREVRVAYMFVNVGGALAPVQVQVAETNDKRVRLASDISSAVFAAQFLILPVALLLIWFGLSEGFCSLDEIRETIASRKPEDLSAIDPAQAPKEVRAFIVSINELMKRLDMSLKVQQRFIADAAHQMRTPLAGLKTQAELALRQQDGEGMQYSIRQIAAGADRASRLINQLLTLARADSDAPRMEDVELESLAREAAREWFAVAQEKRIDLGFESAGGPRVVSGNGVLLQELLNNLLDNAIRYTAPGGRVTVRVCDAERCVLEVEDNGIGIDPRERTLVFERFYRVLGTGGEGSGLGLAIVKEIASLHGAGVTLEANPRERGTLARIAFARSHAAVRTLRNAA